MAKRLLGTGVTDSSGVAVMNKDAQGQTINGYTGTGAGEIDIVAEVELEDSSILVSETYGVLDAKSYDDGTATLSDYWTNTNALTRNSDNTTTFSASNFSSSNFKVANNSNISFTNGTVVEFDLLEIEGSPRINGYDGANKGVILAETGHYKVVFKDNTMTVTVDGTVVDSIAFDTTVSTFNVGFRTGSAVATIKFDNFLLY